MSITVDPSGYAIGVKKAKDALRISDSLRAAAEIPMEQKAIQAMGNEEIFQKYPELKDLFSRPGMTRVEKKFLAKAIIRKAELELKQNSKLRAEKQAQLEYCEMFLAAREEYKQWAIDTKFPKLEKNDCSRLHSLIQRLKEQKQFMDEAMRGMDVDKFPWDEIQPFVVQHNWAAAFQNATDYDGEYKLPYEMSAFELRINGRNVTVLESDVDGVKNSQMYVAAGNVWVSPDSEDPRWPFEDFALSQVKAICVALDAEVAQHSVTRANEQVNRRRVKDGKVPFYSYHTVSLVHRTRIANPSPHTEIGKRKRLHFRRGHWRHYEKFKTWVRWCLVGDPELGFIDKEYRV